MSLWQNLQKLFGVQCVPAKRHTKVKAKRGESSTSSKRKRSTSRNNIRTSVPFVIDGTLEAHNKYASVSISGVEKVPHTGRVPRAISVKRGDLLHKGKDDNYRLVTKKKIVHAIALESISKHRKNRWIKIDKVHDDDTFRTTIK